MLRMREGVQHPWPVNEQGEPTVGLNATAIQGEGPHAALRDAVRLLESLAPDLVHETGEYITTRRLVPYVASGPSAPTDATIDKVLASLRSAPARTWSGHRVIPFALLETATLSLGPYTLWRFPDEVKRLLRPESEFKTEDDVRRAMGLEDKSVLVEIPGVRARYSDRAYEISNERFERLGNVLRYMSGPWTRGFTEPPVAMALTTDATAGGGRFASIPSNFRWSIGEWCRSPEMGHDRVWAMLAAASLSDMETRIITAVEWIGRGLNDSDRTKAFVQFMFAFEALLNFESDRASRFAPSLGHGMGEIAAFVLIGDLSGRKAVWMRFKELYGVRSGIAHGAGVTARREDYDDAFRLVTDLIRRLLTDASLRTFRSHAQLREWTSDLRFA
jgi:hypothetical protein